MTIKQPRWMNLRKIEMSKFVPVTIHSEVNSDDFEIFVMKRNELESYKLLFSACIKMIRKYWLRMVMQTHDVGSVPIKERVPYGLEDMEDTTRSGGSAIIRIPHGRYDNKFEFAADLLMSNGFYLYRPQFEAFKI